MKKEINIKNITTIQSYRKVKDNKWLATLTFDCTLGNATEDKLEELIKSKNAKIVYEAEDEILDKEEKDYLGNFIRPFRDKVHSIAKMGDDREFIVIEIVDEADIYMPYFEMGTMYKGMEPNKQYTLEELGL